jgi:hypothetical protein
MMMTDPANWLMSGKRLRLTHRDQGETQHAQGIGKLIVYRIDILAEHSEDPTKRLRVKHRFGAVKDIL